MSTISIAAVTKLKHGDLHRAAEKLGGQSALARHLGLHPSEVGTWCNLKKFPSDGMSSDKKAEVERKLFDLTGKTLDQLFPESLKRSEAFLSSNKQFTRTAEIETEALVEYARGTSERLAYRGEENAENNELKERLNRILNTLSWREQQILKMRYGLEDGNAYTLEEVSHTFKVTRERIRQIECRAIRLLQKPNRASQLVSFMSDDRLPDYGAIDAEVVRKSELTLKAIVAEREAING